MRVSIKLTESDIKLIREIAKARNSKSKRFGSKTYDGKNNSEEIHFLGLLGEFAVSKHLKIPLNTEIYNNKGDNGYDFSIQIKEKEKAETKKISVKTTKYIEKPFLRLELDKFNEKIEIYILCCADVKNLKQVEIVGWMNKDGVLKAKKRKLGKFLPTNYILEENELFAVDTLINT